MPTITSIKPQRNQKRVNVYLDGKFGFGIDLENFVKLGLKVEQELSSYEVEKIVKKAEFQKTLDKLLKFATLRPRSEKEIGDWFRRKKTHESLYEELLGRLKRLDLLDDRKFAEWWIEQRKTFSPMGIRRIKAELIQKGIKREDIGELLEARLDSNEQKMSAKKILEKKFERLRKLPRTEAAKKAYSMLAYRGFDYETIEEVIDELGLKR